MLRSLFLFIEDDIHALSRMNGKKTVSGKFRNLIRPYARCVDNQAGVQRTAVCVHCRNQVVRFVKTGYGGFKEKRYAVCRSVFCKGNRYLKRRGNAGVGHPKTAVVFRTQVRFHVLYRFFIHITDATFNAVFCRPSVHKGHKRF